MRQTQEPGAQTPGKELRRGYTTGTCAAAAAKAAAAMLFSGKDVKEVQLTVPAGETLLLEITEISRGPDYVSCAVVKDAGDDPDVTNGMKVLYFDATHFPPANAKPGSSNEYLPNIQPTAYDIRFLISRLRSA